MKLLISVLLLSLSTLANADSNMPNLINGWVKPAGNDANQRYSPLTQVTINNAADLTMAWSFSTGVLRGHEGNPLIIDQTMYVHTPFPNIVYALDLNNDGAIRWKYEPKQNYDQTVPVMCCDTVNRGLAYGDGKIFLNQADTTLVALDMDTGKPIWSHKRDDPRTGATSTGAAFVFKDKVVVGVSGSEYGVRGYVQAYDLNGKQIFKAYSTGPDQDMLVDPNITTSMLKPVGANSSLKTWQGDQWKIGGGVTWGWFSYDEEQNVFYYGTANPSTWNPVQRPGDNKWSNSIFARDLDTGIAKWVYQMTPHDEWDFDGVNEIILVEQTHNQQHRHLAVHFDRNGFVYSFDRRNGELLRADKYDESVNWSDGVDLHTGKHKRQSLYSPDFNGEDIVTSGICPSALGVKDQQPAAYSPRTGLFYVPTNHVCMDYEPFEVEYVAGQPYVGASITMKPIEDATEQLGRFVAWDARQGKKVWDIPERFSIWSGALVTASDVVFYGTLEGYLKAVDANTGRELWRFKTPSGIIGNVNTYMHKGTQYVSVLSGIGGWAGIGMAMGYENDSDGDGVVGLHRQLSSWTNLGGILSVFSL
jgi:PQQ-dependent dehydrogenase (methanol/ethanol family)